MNRNLAFQVGYFPLYSLNLLLFVLFCYRPHPKDGEGNSFTLLVCPRGGGGVRSSRGGSGPAAGGGQVQPGEGFRSSCRGGQVQLPEGGGSCPAAGGVRSSRGVRSSCQGGSGPAGGGGVRSSRPAGGQVQLTGGGSGPAARGGVSILCTLAGGMPLAFT